MKIFRKRILPKIWLSAFAIGILFLSFVGATVKASDNQETQKLTGFSFAALSENIFGSSFFTANNAILAGETFQFVPGVYSVSEGDEVNGPTFVNLTVTRTGGNLETTQTVDFITSNGTATASGTINAPGSCNQTLDPSRDYVPTVGTLTFLPGVTSQTFQVQICGDDVFEGNTAESFNVVLLNPTNQSLLGDPSAAIVNIIEDDNPSAGQFSIQQAPPYVVSENTPGFVDVIINRNGSDVPASVIVTTSTGTQQNPTPGTATGGTSCGTPGVDFVNRAETVNFAAGQTTVVFRVLICDDNFFEDDETFTVSISNAPGSPGTVDPASSSTTVTIDDNDANTPGQLNFVGVSQTIVVPERSDAAPATNPTITLGVTRTGGTSGAITASYSVVGVGLRFATVGDTTLGCNNGTPNNPNDDPDILQPPAAQRNNSIQFASGSSTLQTITLTICNDTLNEFVTENFQVVLGGPTTSPDPAVPVTFGAGSVANGTILDGENGSFSFTTSTTPPAGTTITPNPATVTGTNPNITLTVPPVPESNGFTEVTVFRVNPGQALLERATVDYTVEPIPGAAAGTSAVGGATCAPGIDYAVTPGAVTGTLTFGPGISSQSFQIQICDDSVFEPGNATVGDIAAEMFRVRLSNPQIIGPDVINDRPLLGNEGTYTEFSNLNPSGATTFRTINGVSPLPNLLNLSITENDPANSGVVTVTASAQSVPETTPNSTVTFTFTRTTGEGNVRVPFTVSGAGVTVGSCASGADISVPSSSVTFVNGSTTQTVVVTICDDTSFEGVEQFTVTLGTPVQATNLPAGSTPASIGTPNSATVTILDNDAQAGIVSIPSGVQTVPEFAGTVQITVTRTSGSNGAISVPYYFQDGGPNGFAPATGGTTCTAAGTPFDYFNPNNSSAANPQFVFFASGETTATIPVTICNDTIDDPDFEEFQLILGPQAAVTGGATISNTNNVLTFRIQDDENGVVFFGTGAPGSNTFAYPELNSGRTSRAVTVTRTNTNGTVTVQASITGGTATGGADCTAGVDYINPGVTSLQFNPGVSAQQFFIEVCGDTFFEDNETINFTLTPVGNNVIVGTPSTAQLIITNDDATPTFTISNPSVTEGDAGQVNLQFVVTLNGQSNLATAVTATTVGGTATAGPAAAGCTPGVDYLTTTQVLNFPASSNATQTVTFNVPVCGDLLDELAETVLVSLSAVNPANTATIPAGTQGVGTINDNDATPTLTINNVTMAEGNSGTTNFVFTVTSSATSGLAQNFTYSVVPGTTNPATPGAACTTAGVDFIAPAANTAATIAAGSSSFTITVPVCGDTINEADETFFVQLNSVTGGGNTTIPANTQGVGTITNDDAAPTLTISNVTQAEGNSGTTNFVFTVTSSAVTQQNVTFNYSVVPGTPNPATGGAACTTAGVDFVQPAANQPLTITAGQTTATITVAVCGDLLDELNETFFVNLSSAVNATIPANTQGVGTITDDDATPSLAITNVTQAEGNAGVTNFIFSVTPSAASGQQITVNYTTAPGTLNPATAGPPGQCTAGADFQTTSGTLTFTAGSAAAQTITVPVCGDTIDELDETFVVFLSGVTNATLPANAQGLGTITDDDAGPGSVTSTSSLTTPTRVLEGNAGTQTVTFTFTNNNPNANAATVNFTTSGGTATAGASCATAGVDYVTQTGTLTFAANSTGPQTVTVTVCGDTRKEANETFFINLSGAVNTTIGANTQGVGIIIDDDRAIRADFDIDRRTDLSVFRPSNGFWYILQSVNGLLRAQQFGAAGDIPVPGDYDGDRSTDLAFFRPSTSTWNIYQSTSNSVVTIAFGSTGDIPVQGDYNGDGVTEVAVFRPSTGTFFTSQDPATNFGAIQFGANGDVPVPADYDGDGRTDVAVFRPGTTNATWFVRNSSSGANFGISYGAPTDIPVTGDIDGDGKSDFTVFRTGAAGNPPGVVGAFYTFQSLTQSSTGVAFGQAGDIPSIGDYDGDGTDDISVYRPNSTNGTGTFFFLRSTAGFGGAQFGANTDIPIPSRYQAYRPTQTPLL